MSISINSSSGINQFSAQNNSVKLSEQLSSGSRINSAADDAAGSAISQRFQSQLGGIDAAIRNSGDSISAIQVTDGALSSLTDNIGRIQELAIQSANGSLNDQDRQALQQEASQLIDESNKILENTNLNGKPLLSSDEKSHVQLDSAGSTISIEGKNLAKEFESLGFDKIDLSTQDAATAALDTLKKSSEQVIERASELGAVSNRIESSVDSLSASRVNSAEARSRINDADFAKIASDLAASQVKDQAQISIQAQANGQRSAVLQLLS